MELREIPGTNMSITRDGEVISSTGRRLCTGKPGHYRQIKLWYVGTSIRKTKMIHRLVWETFIGPIPKGMWINHKNGVKDDNRLENLELATPSESHNHASKVLKRRYARGLECHTALCNDDANEAIQALFELGWSQRKIARAIGISQSAVSQKLNKNPSPQSKR